MTTMTVEADRSLVNLTHLTYGLHAIGLALGIFGASTVVGAFLGFPSLIALIINYVKRGDMRGTWLESHVTWQIRTFWWSLLWWLVGVSTLLLGVGFIVLAADAVWVIYRIVKGFLNWNDNRPMPLPASAAAAV